MVSQKLLLSLEIVPLLSGGHTGVQNSCTNAFTLGGRDEEAVDAGHIDETLATRGADRTDEAAVGSLPETALRHPEGLRSISDLQELMLLHWHTL